ncbi:MAG TPA: hypothetical protein VMY35_07680 [Phycisphaerae bacterium]|nr:hypothetical protein [Phycisphaerae bacterium]
MAAVLTEDKRLRRDVKMGAGREYSRTYYGPLNAAALAALLPEIGAAMPAGSDCEAGTLVTHISDPRQASGRAVAMVTITGFHHGTGAVA